MKLLSMLRFQGIFVVQIIGDLLSRQYTGMVSFTFEDRIPISVWLDRDHVTHIQCQGATDINLFYTLLWKTKGKVGMYPKVPIPDTLPINFVSAIETAILKFLPQWPTDCHVLEHIYLQRGRLRPDRFGSLAQNAQVLLQQLPKEGVKLERLRTMVGDAKFCAAFFYLCCDGQLLCSYAPSMGRLFTTFNSDLLKRLTSLFGTRVIDPFADSVHGVLQEAWPDWIKGELPDSLYGSAPYHLWAKTLKIKTATVGIPSLANRCFEQALDKLLPTDAALIRNLM